MGNSRVRDPVRGGARGAPDGSGVSSDNTPGPTGIGYERSSTIHVTAGIPDGVLDGVDWNPEDPLAGITSGIPPFGMLDVWTTYLREPQAHESPRQIRRRRPVITEIQGDGMFVTGQGPNVPLSQVMADIHLQLAH